MNYWIRVVASLITGAMGLMFTIVGLMMFFDSNLTWVYPFMAITLGLSVLYCADQASRE